MQAEVIFKGGPIHVDAGTQVAALALAGDRIVAAGPEARRPGSGSSGTR